MAMRRSGGSRSPFSGACCLALILFALLALILTTGVLFLHGGPDATNNNDDRTHADNSNNNSGVLLSKLEALEESDHAALGRVGEGIKQLLEGVSADSATSAALLKHFEDLAGSVKAQSQHLLDLEHKLSTYATSTNTNANTNRDNTNKDNNDSNIKRHNKPEDDTTTQRRSLITQTDSNLNNNLNNNNNSIDWERLAESAEECADKHAKCPAWAAAGECEHNPGYMRPNCRKACRIPCVPESLWRPQIHLELLSWSPRAYAIRGLLHPVESSYLISIATPRLERSHVMEHDTGKEAVDPIRTSWGMFMGEELSGDPVVRTVDERVGWVAMVPPENGEAMQVLRYELGEHYYAHCDWFKPMPSEGRGDHPGSPGQQRVATVLIYLNDVEAGGETHFPLATPIPGGPYANATCGEEPQKGVSLRPKAGDAVLFWSRTLTGEMDEKSMHAGCPVVKGTKFTATKWLRDGPMELTWKPLDIKVDPS